MNRKHIVPIGLVTLTATLGLTACGTTSTPTSTTASTTSGSSSTPSSTSNASSAVVLPVSSDPIVNNSTNATLQITKAAVEDNVDPSTGKAIADRLQLTLNNTGTTTLSNFEVYYTMTDRVTSASESYYQKLDGLTLAAGASTTVYFDNQAGAGHYPENQFSLYRSSTNQVDFTIEVSASGAKIVTGTATKSKGTGEKVD